MTSQDESQVQSTNQSAEFPFERALVAGGGSGGEAVGGTVSAQATGGGPTSGGTSFTGPESLGATGTTTGGGAGHRPTDGTATSSRTGSVGPGQLASGNGTGHGSHSGRAGPTAAGLGSPAPPAPASQPTAGTGMAASTRVASSAATVPGLQQGVQSSYNPATSNAGAPNAGAGTAAGAAGVGGAGAGAGATSANPIPMVSAAPTMVNSNVSAAPAALGGTNATTAAWASIGVPPNVSSPQPAYAMNPGIQSGPAATAVTHHGNAGSGGHPYGGPPTGPPIPVGCKLYGHSKPSCAWIGYRTEGSSKAPRQLKKHLSIKASTKPFKTQAKVAAKALMKQNRALDLMWQKRRQTQELRALLEGAKLIDQLGNKQPDQVPVVDPVVLPSEGAQLPWLITTMFQLWPLLLALMFTFREELLSLPDQVSLAPFAADGWEVLVKTVSMAQLWLTQVPKVLSHAKLLFISMQGLLSGLPTHFSQLPWLLFEGAAWLVGNPLFWMGMCWGALLCCDSLGSMHDFLFVLPKLLRRPEPPPNPPDSFSRREKRAQAKAERQYKPYEKKQQKDMEPFSFYHRPLLASRFRTPLLRN